MQDVADTVNVSKQTVSAVINNRPGITDATRERVLSAIEQLGYRLDRTAQSLRTGRSGTIALLLTDVSSPFAGKLASVAGDCACDAGYTLFLYSTKDNPDRERDCVSSIIQRSVDGVLFVAARDDSSATIDLEAADIPVVMLDRISAGYDGPSVTIDNRRAGRIATEHLLGLGHRAIAHISGPQTVHISAEREKGFRDSLVAAGISAEPHIERAVDWRMESGYEAMRRLLARTDGFTAVFVAGDLLSIGAMRALRESGRRVPEDVSLVSVDDIDLAAFLVPPLTTVSQSVPQMAEWGVGLLLDLTAGVQPAQTRMVIEPKLVVRQSTAAPSKP